MPNRYNSRMTSDTARSHPASTLEPQHALQLAQQAFAIEADALRA